MTQPISREFSAAFDVIERLMADWVQQGGDLESLFYAMRQVMER